MYCSREKSGVDSDNDRAQVFLYISDVVFFHSIVLHKANQPKQKFKAKPLHVLILNDILVS